MEKVQCLRVDADEQQILRCREYVQNIRRQLATAAKIFSLFGSEPRLAILLCLQKEKELCPCDLADILQMKVSAVSQHLRRLADQGIIRNERRGQTIFYSLDPSFSETFTQILEAVENFVARAVEKNYVLAS